MEQGNTFTVLIVEDEPDMAKMLKMLLERKFSATVEIAEDCASAKEKLEFGTFDIITVDYHLPGGDGLELLQGISEIDDPPPVIMVTGHGDEQTAVESFKNGAIGYVVKDKRLSTLLPDAVEHALSEIRLRHAEVELRKSEEQYRLLAENATDVIWTTDMDMNWTYISPSVERVRGYTVEEAMSQTMEEVGTTESFKYAMDVLAEELEADKERNPDRVKTLEVEQYCKDGSTIWVSITMRFLRDDDGNIVGILGVSRDTTERKRVEEELFSEREHLLSLFESIDEVIYVVDPESHEILYANKFLKDAFGKDLVGGICYRELQGLDEPCEFCTDEIIFRNKGEPYTWEYHNPILDRDYLITDRVIKWPDNRDVRFELAIDITERKRAEEELKRINEELKGYAHTVSHDLKGPLSGIMLGVEVLADSLEGAGMGDVGETSEIVEVIDGNARNAQRRINDLLALAESGQEPRETSLVDVGEVVEGVLGERSHEIKEKSIEMDVSSDLGTVTGNPTQVRQVFSNLVRNAIRYNDSEDPVIRISHLGDDEDGGHRYLVRDNGPGIPEDIIDDVFLTFAKGENGDTGIGLSIAERVVKVYGGQIRAYNDNGACFEFTLRDF